MKATLKYALIFSFASIIAKIIMWQKGLLETDATPSSMIYLAALLISIFLSLNEVKTKEQTEPTSYFTDLKVAMRSVSYFTIIIAVFTFIYYKYIDWDFMYDRIAARVDAAEALELTKENNLRGLTKEEFVDSERKIAETIFSPSTHATITLMGFMLIGGIYSTLLTFLVRMSPKFKSRSI